MAKKMGGTCIEKIESGCVKQCGDAIKVERKRRRVEMQMR